MNTLRRRASLVAGLVVVAAALSTPFDSAADSRLSVHMAQHMLLLSVAPPLIVYGRPLLRLLIGLPLGVRRSLGPLRVLRPITHPFAVWVAYTAGVWSWHLPRLYDAAENSLLVHVAEHATFLAVGLLLWAVVVGGSTRRRVSYPAAVALVFTTMVSTVWLAMILSFSPRAIYAAYESVGDQQLAGAVMWAPMAVGTMATIGVLVYRFIRSVDLRAAREAAA